METQLWAIITVIAAGLVGGLGPIYLKKGANLIKRGKFKSIIINKSLIVGLLIYGISTLIFIPALKGGELSVLYPFVGLSYVWVCIFSVFMLKERMTLLKWAGILTIVIGVSLIGMGT